MFAWLYHQNFIFYKDNNNNKNTNNNIQQISFVLCLCPCLWCLPPQLCVSNGSEFSCDRDSQGHKVDMALHYISSVLIQEMRIETILWL